MADRSWWVVEEDAPEHRLPDDLRARDSFGGRDCGWVEQMRPFVRDFSRPGDTVFDPFCGFGTTLLAAALEGRRGLGMEIDAGRATLARERLARHGIVDPVVAGALPQCAIPQPIALCLTNIPYFGCRWPADTNVDQSQLYAASDFGAYLEGLRDIFHAVRAALPEGGYCIAMAENVTLNGRMLPIAWELARVLGSLFETCDERVLCYPPRPSHVPPSDPARTDRSHEYALVYRKARPRIDIERGRSELLAMRDAGFAFRVHGSFAAWEHMDPDGVQPPSDIDLHVPADEARLQALLHWLVARGYRLRLWDEPVDATVPLQRVIEQHYVRAERIDTDGGLMRIDVGIAVARPDASAHAFGH